MGWRRQADASEGLLGELPVQKEAFLCSLCYKIRKKKKPDLVLLMGCMQMCPPFLGAPESLYKARSYLRHNACLQLTGRLWSHLSWSFLESTT